MKMQLVACSTGLLLAILMEPFGNSSNVCQVINCVFNFLYNEQQHQYALPVKALEMCCWEHKASINR